MNKIRTIVLENDMIDIFYNTNLTRKPYLLRMYNYHNETYEVRLDENDLQELSQILEDLSLDDDATVIE